MTKALAPHTPSIPASLIRPQQAEAEGFVGAKKQKARAPSSRMSGMVWVWRGGGGGSLSGFLPATNLVVPVRSHHDSTFRRLGRNQALRFVVVRLTKRVRRNHAFRGTPLLCSLPKQRSPATRGLAFCPVKHHYGGRDYWGPKLRTPKVCSGKILGPKTGPGNREDRHAVTSKSLPLIRWN